MPGAGFAVPPVCAFASIRNAFAGSAPFKIWVTRIPESAFVGAPQLHTCSLPAVVAKFFLYARSPMQISFARVAGVDAVSAGTAFCP